MEYPIYNDKSKNFLIHNSTKSSEMLFETSFNKGDVNKRLSCFVFCKLLTTLGKLLYASFKFNVLLLIDFISSKWSLLYTRFIYYNDPNPYIPTFPDPNNDVLGFEPIPAYKPVLGVIPAADGTNSS